VTDMPEFEAAIFDLDGTLLDSMGLWEQIDIDFLGKRGIEATKDYIRAVTPLDFAAAAEYTIRRFHLEESAEDIILEWKRMCRDAYEQRIGLKPHAKEYLLALKQSGVKLGVATALTPDLSRLALEHNRIAHLFEAFASRNEVDRGKGFPDVYLLAAQRLGVPPEKCMVFEDILSGISGARAGGFLTCGVFDAWSAHEWKDIMVLADLAVQGFGQLL